jgi:predicted component of type VI protein secretion system
MTKEEESGLDELMRLSRQFTRQQEENEAQERQRQAQGKKVRGVLQGLKDLNISMSVEQLKAVAPKEVIDKVNSLKNQEGTEDLRKMISGLADDLEKRLADIPADAAAAAPLANSMRMLNILMDLYFSLQ